MRVAERLKKAIEVDPTRAVVDYNRILREEKNEEEPLQYSRLAGRQRRISELERARRRTDKNAVLYFPRTADSGLERVTFPVSSLPPNPQLQPFARLIDFVSVYPIPRPKPSTLLQSVSLILPSVSRIPKNQNAYSIRGCYSFSLRA